MMKENTHIGQLSCPADLLPHCLAMELITMLFVFMVLLQRKIRATKLQSHGTQNLVFVHYNKVATNYQDLAIIDHIAGCTCQ